MPQKKINHSDLPSVSGQTVVIRSNVDNSEIRGVVIATLGNFALVQQNRSQFYVPLNPASPQYIFTVD